jgi:Lon-like ATP-dependent protease
MEILQVSGYITEEKAAIASKYLAPQAKDGAGLKNADVTLTDDAVAALIRYYCRESGVRRLKQQIEKVRLLSHPSPDTSLTTSPPQVYRKAALKIVQDIGALEVPAAAAAASVVAPLVAAIPEVVTTAFDNLGSIAPIEPTPAVDGAVAEAAPAVEEVKTSTRTRTPLEVPSSVHVTISAENLLEYVGPPMYQKDRLYTKTSPVGVSCGLGYLGNGSGAVMPIEVTVRLLLSSLASHN